MVKGRHQPALPGRPLGRSAVRSHHRHLTPELLGEDRLRNERVDAADDVHDLGHAEAHRDAAQRVGVELADLRLGRQELDRVARGKRHGRIQVLVQADDDPVRIRFGHGPGQFLLLVQNDLDAQLLHARLEGSEANLAVALHRMAVARIDERAGLPDRDVERRALRQLAEIEVARVRAWRHRAGDAGAQGGEIAVGWRQTQGALEGLERNADVGRELALHPAQVEVEILDLPLRIVLGQQTGPERARIAEDGPPFVRTDPLIADLQHIPRLGLVHDDRSDDRMRPLAGIVHAQLRERIDRHARLHFIEEVGPGIGEADHVARIDAEDGCAVGVEHPELHGLLGRRDHVHAALLGCPLRPCAGFLRAREPPEPWLDGGERTHEGAGLQELAAPMAAR